MIRSIYCNDDIDDCLNIETVICKVYFPHIGEDGRPTTWSTSSPKCEQTRNKEIRRFNLTNKSFNQFFELVTSSIVEPSTDVELLVLDADSDWIPVYSDEQWTAVLNTARTLPNMKKQLRVRVTGRDGSSVTPKPAGTKKRTTTSRRNNSSCCIIPTKTEAYPCFESSNFLSIKQDFCAVQQQLEAMRLQQEEKQQEKKKAKKKATSDKKKRSSSKKSEIVSQIAEIYNNWSPALTRSKWGSDSSTIAVL